MKILLTGATGFIGKELGKRLVSQGHQIVAVTRSVQLARVNCPYPAEFIEWSGVEPLDDPRLSAIDGVIHLMGQNLSEGRWTTEVKQKLVNSRVDSTIFLREAFERTTSNLKFWIQGSAIGFYGSSEREQIFDESSPKGEGFLSDLCDEWESALNSTQSQFNSIRKVILRTGVVISHRGGALEKMINPLLAGLGGVVAGGRQRMSLIHLDDLVSFVSAAVQNDQINGIYNLVTKEPVEQRDLISMLSDHLFISNGMSVPSFAIRLAMGEMGDLVLQDQAVTSSRIQKTGFQWKYPGLKEIVAEIAQWYLDPVSVERGAPKPAYLMYNEQFLPLERNEVFKFFSDARNLEKITPDFLNFSIVGMSTEQLEKNSKITYRLKLHGIPFNWLTDISVWDPPYRFVDQQLKGPYQLWYHEHAFEAVPGGTLMRDWVRFRLPFGKAGLVGLPKVLGDVSRIFAYRTEIIHEILLKN